MALGLLATCKLDLEACRGEEEGQRGWLEMALIISAARLVIYFLNHPSPPFREKVQYSINITPPPPFVQLLLLVGGRGAWPGGLDAPAPGGHLPYGPVSRPYVGKREGQS